MENENKTTVYYDGSCPLCIREMSVFQKRNEGEVEFVDVSSETFTEPTDLTKNQAMARFHVRDKEGKLENGAAAFVALWLETRGFKTIGKMVKNKPTIAALDIFYNLFLKVRPGLQSLTRLLVNDKG